VFLVLLVLLLTKFDVNSIYTLHINTDIYFEVLRSTYVYIFMSPISSSEPSICKRENDAQCTSCLMT